MKGKNLPWMVLVALCAFLTLGSIAPASADWVYDYYRGVYVWRPHGYVLYHRPVVRFHRARRLPVYERRHYREYRFDRDRDYWRQHRR